MRKTELDLEKGLYFVHSYYLNKFADDYHLLEADKDIITGKRNQMILLKDSMDDLYSAEAFDVNLEEIGIEDMTFPEGTFVYYNPDAENKRNRLQSAENDPTAILYTEVNRQLTRVISYENYGNRPKKIEGAISDVHSYHVHIGHGNCSIIVFKNEEKYQMWMIDCSVFDFTNRYNYSSNLKKCLSDIKKQFQVDKISKLLVTHLHYDHINGIEYLIKKEWMGEETEVWMNTQYPWKTGTCNRILSQLHALGVRFIDPIVANSTEHIQILYPYISFNQNNVAPRNNINNASVLYQVFLGEKNMLFTGDLETEGWNAVVRCYPNLQDTTYYCISHHGSINGDIRTNCLKSYGITSLSQCTKNTKRQLILGRDGAYKGIFNPAVVSRYRNILRTEEGEHYIEIIWSTDTVNKK